MEVFDGNRTLIIDPEKSCRLCLSQSSEMQNIFSRSIFDGCIVSIVDMLAYTLDIAIVNMNNRLLPNQICIDCQKQIVGFYIFKQKTKRMEKSLISIFSPETNATDDGMADNTRPVFDSVNLMDEHSQSDLVDLDVIAVESDIEASAKEKEVEMHDLQEETQTNTDIFDIVEGGEEDQLVESTQSLNHNAISSKPKPSQKDTKCPQQPETCEKATAKITLKDYFGNVVMNNDDEFDENVIESPDFSHNTMALIIKYFDFFSCHNCCLLFNSKDSLNEHHISSHPGISPEQFNNSDIDYQFSDVFQKVRVYSCGECKIINLCSKSFVTAKELKSHVLSHSSIFKCPFKNCDSQYKQFGRLNKHVFNRHININHLNCLHCNQSFKTYDEIQTHIRNSCKALNYHLKTISGDKFKCNTCQKEFKHKVTLEIHKRSHTNERPFKCIVCNKSYKTSSMRATHMDTHLGEKTFECKICKKKFKTRVTYRTHMKRHTEGKNYKKHQCEHCDKRFISNHHMRLHQKNIHEQISVDFYPDFYDNDDDNLNQVVNDVNLAKLSDDDDDDIMEFFL